MKPPGSLELKERETADTAWRGRIAEAAAAGRPIQTLLEFAARTLLRAGKADRVAVWVEPGESRHIWRGVVVSTDSACRSGAMPLDITDLPRHMFEGRAPVCWDAQTTLPPQLAGLSAAMHRVMWFPMIVESAPVGAVLVAFAGRVAPENPELLKDLLAELTLAVAAFRESQRLEQAQQEFAACTGLHRAILRGAATSQILEGVASAAVRHAHAEFAAIGRFRGKEIIWQALAGRPECAALLHSTLARDLVKSVEAKGDPVLRSLHTSEADRTAEPSVEVPTVYSLVALPLEGERTQPGVLLAGFAPGRRGGEKRLEPYVALASAALAREGKPTEFAGFEAAFTALFEESSEALLLVDSSGLVHQASQGARELLGLKEKRPKAVKLLDLFLVSARDGVAAWLQRAAGELPPPPGGSFPGDGVCCPVAPPGFTGSRQAFGALSGRRDAGGARGAEVEAG